MRFKPLIFLAVAIAFAGGCAATQGKDEALLRLESQVAELRASAEDTRARLDDLNNKFALLHEKVEASESAPVNEDVSRLPDAPPAGLKVVDLGESEFPEPTGVTAKADKKTAPKIAETPEEIYNRAQDLFMAGRYALARDVFTGLAGRYPGHTLADNALYWAGEAYYTEKDFANAVLMFTEVARKYPLENKAPDALLKAGFASMEMRDRDKARGYFADLLERYPDSEAALKARRAFVTPGDE